MEARGRIRGFTLLELLLVVALLAILAGIALPSYQGYVQRSKVRIAQSDLLAWSALVESHRQRTLAFPADESSAKQGFQPASRSADFSFAYPASGAGYPLTANGVNGSPFTGCSLTLGGDGSRGQSGCPGGAGGAW